ncbi:MAG TPA: sigma-70 family RNA polymerase sigma factor, partial [Candidatus Dormibacteraeota bacterium]|nr:sigma-70 family RNA polymerase sigma factor [Candidatus Dormibacteraeota bacterium]
MTASHPGAVGPGSPADALPSDEALLERIAGGDQDALTELYDRHRSMTYAIALRITGSVAAAEDVLQDAFLGAWRNAGRFERSRGTGRSWLLSIVHHRAIDHVRRRRAGLELPDPESPLPPALVA